MTERSIVARLRADISDMQRGLRTAAADMGNIGKAAEQTSARGKSAFATLAKSTVQHEQSINRLSNTSLGLGAAVAVGVGAMVKSFADFDQKMSNVAATGDDARKNIDALRAAAIDMGAKTVFSAGEAADGITEMLKAGVSAKDVLGGGLKGALDLAAAGQLDVGQAANIAATAMQQFNLRGDQVGHVADLLAAGAGKAQGEVTDMAEALKFVGPVAHQMGVSIEETTGTIAEMASQGILAGQAGTSLRGMLTALTSPSKVAADTMKRLGINVYDAHGQFVGFRGVAGELHDQLGKLTNAERDEALGRIFGNEQITAARVLYEQGAAGVDKWTKSVDDSGFAARTAAAKMDNLKGDIENLRGSIETAFIKGGSGANAGLRGLAQDATRLVNTLGDLPAPLVKGGVEVAAFSAASLLAAGGIGKMVVAGSKVYIAFQDLSAAAPSLAGKLATVGKVAGTVAVAFAAMEAAGALMDTLHTSTSLTQTASDLIDLGKSADVAGSGIDKFFHITEDGRATFNDFWQTDVRGLNDALDRLLNKTNFQKFNDAISGWLPGKDVAEQLTAQFSQLDQSLTNLVNSGAADQAAAGFAKIAAAAAAQGVPIEKLMTLFPQYKSLLQDQANQLGVTTLSAQDYADWMGGHVPDAVSKAAASSGKATTAFTNQTGAQDQLKSLTDQLIGAEDQLHKATDQLINDFTVLNQGALNQESANEAWLGSLDDLITSTKGHSHSLDINTDAGRKNRAQIVGDIKAMNDKITADFQATAKSKGLSAATDEASTRLGTQRRRLEDAAVAAGFNRGEVHKMIDQMLLTPKELRTLIATKDMDKVKRQIRDLQRQIADLKNHTVQINFSTNANKFYTTRSPSGRTVRVKDPGLAGGGPVQNLSGRGRKGVDTEHLLGAYGEHMWTDKEVDAVGGHSAMYRMRSAALSGAFRGFVGGGAVERRYVVDTHGIPRSAMGLPGAMSQFASVFANQIGSALANDMTAALAGAGGGPGGPVGAANVANRAGLTTFRGGTFTNLFAAGLRTAEKASGHTFVVFQGGFRPTTSYSGSTHNEDAIDARVDRVLGLAFRRYVGAMGDRTGLGNWAPHMHGVPAPGHGYGSPSARAQYQDYLRRGGGSQSFRSPWGLYDGGGVLDPGLNLAYNGTAQTEAVFTDGQLRALIRAVGGPGPRMFASPDIRTSSTAAERPTVVFDQQFNVAGPDAEAVAQKVRARTLDAVASAGLSLSVGG
jgi:TP901 family phage tail tape measure protein